MGALARRATRFLSDCVDAGHIRIQTIDEVIVRERKEKNDDNNVTVVDNVVWRDGVYFVQDVLVVLWLLSVLSF